MAVVRARSTWHAVGLRSFDAALGCVLPFVYLVIAFGTSAVWGALLFKLNLPTQQEIGPLFGTNALAIALGYFGTAIVAPFAEETFFRGFVIGGLRRRFGAVGALLISAVFFALLHPPFTIFPVIFVLGLLLGLLFLQTGSLYPGILMHAMFNTVGFIAQVFVTNNGIR
jgi:membrane protease YdiL (CAAX protease family)